MNRAASHALLLGLVLATCLLSLSAQARDTTIEPEPMLGRKVRIDGLLKEWPAQFANMSVTLKGSGSASGMVGYDEQNLYVAIKAKDLSIARTPGAQGNEDHAVLYLAFPSGRGYVTHNIQLYPGNPGKLPAMVKVGGRSLKTAKAVESLIEGGLAIEAQIPWSSFPQAKTTRVGLKAALRYYDASRPGAIKSIVATSAATGGSMPDMPLEAEQALRGALIKGKGLKERPVRQVVGNVFGDALLERVAVYGQYLSVVGPGYRGGKEFYFGELGTQKDSDLTRLELRDFSGDGLSEIVVQKRVGSDSNYREVLLVFQLGTDGTPRVAFAHEVAIIHDKLRVTNKVTVSSRGITIEQGKSKGVEPGEYDEPLPPDMPSVLLPWEEIKSRTFSWKGDTLVQSDEKAWQPKMKSPRASVRRDQPSSGSSATPVESSPAAPPPPRPPSADELLEQVYTLYKKDRGVGRAKPRFDFVTDVAADGQTERVLVHDRDIVVFGKGFREGRSYAFLSMGFDAKEDVLAATARDLTGDGKAEIIVRGVLQAKASKALGGDVVQRYALYVYQVQGVNLSRIFAAEMGRALGEDRVLGALRFQPAKRSVTLVLAAARAVGWTEKTYPFPEDTTAAGGLEPLLLPWSSLGERRYVYDGQKFALQ